MANGGSPLPQQRLDALADIMIARALPEIFGKLVVVIQRPGDDLFPVLPVECHARSQIDWGQSVHTLTPRHRAGMFAGLPVYAPRRISLEIQFASGSGLN